MLGASLPFLLAYFFVRVVAVSAVVVPIVILEIVVHTVVVLAVRPVFLCLGRRVGCWS
jgi:hypothetical protein